MKYGLIYYKNTHNLGDDILSYVGKKFLPKVDYYIDREHLDVFIPDEKEYVATIANGWFLHYCYTFQPSPYIYPLFIDTHFTTDAVLFEDYSYIDETLIQYLQQHGPIGCRDYHTANILSTKGIPNYFSGCLTLTLKKFANVMPTDKIVLVDVSENVTNYIHTILPGADIISKTHRLQDSEAGLSWSIREERVENFLKLYQSAKIVITTRLHCALPCIALGTPVIFIGKFDKDYTMRIESFSDYFPCFSEEDFLNHKADAFILQPQKVADVSSIANDLTEKCNQFIATTLNAPPDYSALPSLELYSSIYIKRTQYMRYTIESLFQIRAALQNQCVAVENEIQQVMSICTAVADENERLKDMLHKNS